MDVPYRDIYKNIEKKNWITPSICSISLGYASSPILQTIYEVGTSMHLFYQPILLGLSFKLVVAISSMGIGWTIGKSFCNTEYNIEELYTNPDTWKIINKVFVSNDRKVEFKEGLVETMLTDTSLDIGKLFHFCNFIFIERYEHLLHNECMVMQDYRHLAQLLTLKHPMYSSENYLTILDIIEYKVMNDLYPYIHVYYLMNQSNKQRNINNNHNYLDCYPKNKQILLEKAIKDASLIFRHLPHEQHPNDKVSIMLQMVKGLEKDFKNMGMDMCCDDLIPVVAMIIIDNKDILPSADIQMIYDYLIDVSDEKAYVATILMSGLAACISTDESKTPLVNDPLSTILVAI